MKRIRYTKYTGDPASEMSMEDMLKALSEYLLDSGFQDPWSRFSELNGEHTLDNLREALRQALEAGDLFDGEMQQRIDEMVENGEWDELIDKIMQRMEQENYISTQGRQDPNPQSAGGQAGMAEGQVRFEVTDKSLDFLGFKTLRDLLGSLGKSSFGRHDTRHFATGIEASGASKTYEFGDTLNLDTTTTLSSAIAREGISMPLNLEYSDLHVHQCEYQSSCATVVMLDCSHSMILYGEDRFTPAKKVAMALSHLINPREGLRVARRVLERQRKDMKQIVMITDGMPSALTLPDGRIYKNAFGLDPLVVSETLEEVARCKRSNIMINTFMLASDLGLVQFVQKMTKMCRGKAYFTTPDTLGEYLLMDYMSRKMRTIH